jgi:mono/diheme cytochrome c family protein
MPEGTSMQTERGESMTITTTPIRSTALALAVLLATTTGAWAQQGQPRGTPNRDLGKAEYDSNCASCHGPQGKGDGVLKPFLTKSAPDLTQLSKANGGVLPVSRIYAVIEGSDQPTVHGTRDMPAWGFEYRNRAAEYYGEMPYDPEAFVRARVLALIDYVARLQAR